MITVRDTAAALAKALPDALIIEHVGRQGVFIHKAAHTVSLPEFVVTRGFIIGDEVDAPAFEPPLTDEQVLRANVTALVKHRNRLMEALLQNNMGPGRTLITLRGHTAPDSINVGMWVY